MDEKKLEAIARSYHRSLPAEARSACGAEDLAQSARLKSWLVESRYDPGRASRATFLRRVVDNQLRDEFKRVSRYSREVKVDFSVFDYAAFRQSEADQMEAREAADKFLRSLSDGARQAFSDLARGRLRRAKSGLEAHREEIMETALVMGVSLADLVAVFG